MSYKESYLVPKSDFHRLLKGKAVSEAPTPTRKRRSEEDDGASKVRKKRDVVPKKKQLRKKRDAVPKKRSRRRSPPPISHLTTRRPCHYHPFLETYHNPNPAEAKTLATL